ncbi:MAG: hypothetical protein ABSD92_03345 [Candidatus Bathyarchaeia archaeon]
MVRCGDVVVSVKGWIPLVRVASIRGSSYSVAILTVRTLRVLGDKIFSF